MRQRHRINLNQVFLYLIVSLFWVVGASGSGEAQTLAQNAPASPGNGSSRKLRYHEIADQITALGREKAQLSAKRMRTPQEEQRLAQLDADLEIATTEFHRMLEELEGALSSPASAKGSEWKISQIRETQGLMEDLRELGAGTVAVYTIVMADRYAVIVVTPDAQVARETLIPMATLNQKIFQFRDALRNPSRDPRPLAQELYQILIAPIATDLAGAQAQTLMWSLDGALRYLPIAALHDGKQYLVERYRNVIFTPVSTVRLKDKPQHPQRMLGVGVAKAQGEYVAMPGVAAELHALIKEDGKSNDAGLFPGTVLLDEAFTAQALQQALQQRYSLVHIASPFRMGASITDSFLRLGDGASLTSEQAKTALDFTGVDLVTFSSCPMNDEKQLDSGREIEGQSVLLQRKGAKAVLLPLWQVDDKSTKEFMLTFYRLWQTKNLSKAEALQQAQLQLLRGEIQGTNGQSHRGATAIAPSNEGSETGNEDFSATPKARYAHPYYWAPFILIGNWQ